MGESRETECQPRSDQENRGHAECWREGIQGEGFCQAGDKLRSHAGVQEASQSLQGDRGKDGGRRKGGGWN